MLPSISKYSHVLVFSVFHICIFMKDTGVITSTQILSSAVKSYNIILISPQWNPSTIVHNIQYCSPLVSTTLLILELYLRLWFLGINICKNSNRNKLTIKISLLWSTFSFKDMIWILAQELNPGGRIKGPANDRGSLKDATKGPAVSILTPCYPLANISPHQISFCSANIFLLTLLLDALDCLWHN